MFLPLPQNAIIKTANKSLKMWQGSYIWE